MIKVLVAVVAIAAFGTNPSFAQNATDGIQNATDGIQNATDGIQNAIDGIQSCGNAQYYPSQYTCYDGDFLCPILQGEPTLRCGDACYSRYQYSCDGNLLNLLPFAEGRFSVEAGNPLAPFYQLPFQACGRRFLLGPDEPCTFCPSGLPEEVCRAGNRTLFNSGTSLSVFVPGGQQYYIEPNGALGFSQARSFSIPSGSVFGVTAYANGGFTYNGAPWTACPIDGEGDDQRWQVFAQLPGLFFPATCISFEALVVPDTSGRPGAWQYT